MPALLTKHWQLGCESKELGSADAPFHSMVGWIACCPSRLPSLCCCLRPLETHEGYQLCTLFDLHIVGSASNSTNHFFHFFPLWSILFPKLLRDYHYSIILAFLILVTSVHEHCEDFRCRLIYWNAHLNLKRDFFHFTQLINEIYWKIWLCLLFAYCRHKN